MFLLGGIERIVEGQLQPPLLRPKHHRLAVHAAHQVKRLLGLASECQLQGVFLDAGFNGFAHFAGDLEKTVRGAKALDALMRPFMVIILGPQPHPLLSAFETLKLRFGQKLLEYRFPEPFDLPKRHGMMGARPDMLYTVLLKLRLELRGPSPVDILSAIVRQHLLGNAVLRSSLTVELQHVIRRLRHTKAKPNNITGVVVDKSDEIDLAAAHAKHHDVALP